MQQGNIVKALSEINKGIGSIGKDRRNQQQGFQYRGIDDVMNELHGLFAKHEVIILPEVMNIETTEKQTKSGGTLFYVKAKIRFSFTCSDGSAVTSVVVGEAMDSGDKATNKAMSIALKYALLQMFLIPTEEDKDPDATTHEVKAAAKKPEPKQLTEAEIKMLPEYIQATDKIIQCQGTDELKAIWNTFKTFQNIADFKSMVSKKRKELEKVLA